MTITCSVCNRPAKVPKWDTSGLCKACEKARADKRRQEAAEVIKSGHCPTCGAVLRRNLSLTGWYQCSQLGADGFRADSSKPSCDFQIFA